MISRLALSTFAAMLAGCATVAPPRLLHPGTAQTQQRRAEEFDPYPLPELGPPTEARPRGFLLPAPDTERVQNADTYVDRFRQPPPPGLYRPPRSLSGPGVSIAPPPVLEGPAVLVP